MHALRITEDDVDTLAADGRIVHLRDLGPADLPALLALHDRASDRSIYLRYFSANREAARRYVASLADAKPGRRVIGAFLDATLVGVGLFECTAGESAEFALLVADAEQHGGIGTLLFEHLIAEARGTGVRRLTAEVLADNALMLQVIADLGFAARTHLDHGEMHVEFDLDVAEPVISAICEREEVAGAASLRPLLAPRSVVVVGAGAGPGTAGHEALRRLLTAGFAGPVHVVDPHHTELLNVPCVPSLADLPDAPQLALIAVPPEEVLGAVRACGGRGVRAAVLLGPAAAGPVELLATARAHHLRLLGPDSVGLLNTDPHVRLAATPLPLPQRPGPLAVFARSGALGATLLEAADAAGLGIAQFASLGDKLDVAGNDLLLAWEGDPRVRVIGAQFDAIADPRRFARIARRVAQRKPVLVVHPDRDAETDALLCAAGVLPVPTIRALVDAARLLAGGPLPAGPRVAVVATSAGLGALAAEAAAAAGLGLARFDATTAARLRALGLPARNPLDLGADARPERLLAVLRAVAAAPSVDAVVPVLADLPSPDPDALLTAAATAATGADIPFAAVRVGMSPHALPLGGPRELPVYPFPEEALAALGVAHRYGVLRARPPALPRRPDGVDVAGAGAVVAAALAAGRTELSGAEARRVLAAYRIPRRPAVAVHAVHDPRYGPLLSVPAGAGRACALAPLAEAEARQLLGDRADGRRAGLLVRLGALLDDRPEIAEVGLDPEAEPAVRVGVPPPRPDPLVRQLRGAG